MPTIRLRHDWPGWWSKLELFSDLIDGDLLYLDLDTTVLGDLSPYDVSRTTMLRDFYYPQRLGSGFMYIAQADKASVFDAFKADPAKHMRDNRTRERWGDQGFLQSVLGDCQRWQDVAGGIYSYKAHCSRGVPDDARVICFHGKPRPWDVESSLVGMVDPRRG